MQKPQDSCAGGPLLDSVGILPRLFDSHCFFIQQTADTTMLQRLSSCFRVRLGPSVREQQPYCTAPVAMWGWKKGGGAPKLEDGRPPLWFMGSGRKAHEPSPMLLVHCTLGCTTSRNVGSSGEAFTRLANERWVMSKCPSRVGRPQR